MKRIKASEMLYYILTVGISAVIIISLLLIKKFDQKFPTLTKGTYVGFIKNAFDDEDLDSRITPIYIEVSDKILFVVLRQGWNPIYLNVKPKGYEGPLEISGLEARLRLTAGDPIDGVIVGSVYNLDLNLKGSWEIKLVQIQNSDSFDPSKSEEILNLLAFRHELSKIERDIDEVDRDLNREREAVKKLRHFINDHETLEQRTQEKLDLVKKAYEREERNFISKRREARALAKQLALSERVTDMGNLVSLSRKTLERENRWLESMFDSGGGRTTYDFDSEVKRSKRILELKGEIARLRAAQTKTDDDVGAIKAEGM